MDQAREIRKRHHAGESRYQLARAFGVAHKTISSLVAGETYKE